MTLQQSRQTRGPASGPKAEVGGGTQPLGPRQGEDRQQSSAHHRSRERFSRALGWFSLSLGLPAVATPRELARLTGVPDDQQNRTVLRVVGVRELGVGFGILTQPRSAAWLWGRVAGDAMDLALLGLALRSKHAQQSRVTAATAAVVGVTALDLVRAVQLSRGLGRPSGRVREDRGMHVLKTITVNRSPEEVYGFWHDFRNLPRFMDHLEDVQVIGERRSHWKAKAPAGRTVEWDAEIVEDRPGELIAWRSLEGADVRNSGSVRFTPAPGRRGTEVRVELHYSPPGGVVGATIAGLFGEEPDQQVNGDLRRFKQVMETGEVVQSDATTHGRPHPAQPPKDGVIAQ